MSSSREELDAAIERAISALDVAIIENRLYDDPLRLVLVGLIQTLRAQQRLHAAASQDMAGHLEKARVYLEDARQPVRDEELQRAVTRGVGAHAINLMETIRLGTAAAIAGVVVVFSLIGFGGGVWWQADRMRSEVETAYNTVVAVNDGFGTGLKAIDAAIWLDLIRMNGNIRDSLHQCQPLKEPSGSACYVPLWTLLPAPKTETPATH